MNRLGPRAIKLIAETIKPNKVQCNTTCKPLRNCNHIPLKRTTHHDSPDNDWCNAISNLKKNLLKSLWNRSNKFKSRNPGDVWSRKKIAMMSERSTESIEYQSKIKRLASRQHHPNTHNRYFRRFVQRTHRPSCHRAWTISNLRWTRVRVFVPAAEATLSLARLQWKSNWIDCAGG